MLCLKKESCGQLTAPKNTSKLCKDQLRHRQGARLIPDTKSLEHRREKIQESRMGNFTFIWTIQTISLAVAWVTSVNNPSAHNCNVWIISKFVYFVCSCCCHCCRIHNSNSVNFINLKMTVLIPSAYCKVKYSHHKNTDNMTQNKGVCSNNLFIPISLHSFTQHPAWDIIQ